jgi:hypothetical protein
VYIIPGFLSKLVCFEKLEIARPMLEMEGFVLS